MTALYELIDLLPVGFVPDFAPRHNRLFLFLQEQAKMSEREASIAYLGSLDKFKYFNKLKNELKIELTRYIIANPSWNANSSRMFYENCFRNFSIYKTLLINFKRRAAIEIAETLLPKLIKAELHGFAHITANDLLNHYSSIETSRTLHHKYQKIALEQIELVQAEAIVRKYHAKIALIGNRRESFDKRAIQQFVEAMEQTTLYLKLKSNHIQRLVYSIIIARYIVEYDYDKIIDYCDQALSSFSPKHPNGKSFKFSFLHKKIPALVAKKYFEEAKNMAKTIGRMVPKGSFNWHLALNRRVYICLHAGDYQEAYDLYKAHQQQDCLSEVMQEYWEILRGYIYFLIKVGKIKAYKKEKFSLGKFLNEVPNYSKDKAGNNINILIVQILILMQQDSYGRIIDWVDSLAVYARTYTRNPETKRANLFINMIIKMEANAFHRTATERKTQKLYTQLKNTPIRLGQNLAVEVIPYEVLWAEILQMLEDKFRGSNVRAKKKLTE